MVNQLIPLAQRFIAGQSTRTVSARKLHEVLGVRRDFTNWIRNRIQKCRFNEGEDYIVTVAKIGERQNVRKKDYYLTLDMAKHLAMLENNEMGDQARRYFIDCEKALIEKHAPQQLALPTQHQQHRVVMTIEGDKVTYTPIGPNHVIYDREKLSEQIYQLDRKLKSLTEEFNNLKVAYDLPMVSTVLKHQ